MFGRLKTKAKQLTIAKLQEDVFGKTRFLFQQKQSNNQQKQSNKNAGMGASMHLCT